MLKGINKRMIVIKNLNSEIIEEAHFILKSGKGAIKGAKGNEIVLEANKIISEYHSQQRQLADKSGIGEAKSELEKLLHASRNTLEEHGGKDKDNERIKNRSKEKGERVFPDIVQPATSSKTQDLTEEEIFQDAKFFEHIQGETTPKDYLSNLNVNLSLNSVPKVLSESDLKTSFTVISARKKPSGKFKKPPKSFFMGIGVMSAIIIIIKLIEYIIAWV